MNKDTNPKHVDSALAHEVSQANRNNSISADIKALDAQIQAFAPTSFADNDSATYESIKQASAALVTKVGTLTTDNDQALGTRDFPDGRSRDQRLDDRTRRDRVE